MNRRRFLQSLAALVSMPVLPSLSLGATNAAAPAMASVPANARFWAIYMSGLHGECPPQTLQTMLNIPAADARHYIGQLVADGTIKPNPILRKTLSEFVKTDKESFLNRMKKRLDMKAEASREAEEPLGVIEHAEAVTQTDNTLEVETLEREEPLLEDEDTEQGHITQT